MQLIGPSRHPSVGVVLSLENIIQVAKDALQPAPITCEWGTCAVELNSWSTLCQHLQLHLQPASSQEGDYDCRFQKCAGRIQATFDELASHVMLSHLFRVPLPCPIEGCSELFPRHGQIPVHFEDAHSSLLDKMVPFKSHLLKTLHQPNCFHIHDLPPAPSETIASFHLISYPVARSRKRAHQVSQGSQAARKWSRMMMSQAAVESSDSQPFDPLPPFGTAHCAHAVNFLVQKKPPQPALQLSRPRCDSDPPIPEVLPPLSISFKAFTVKFRELEKAGFVDGTGEWPESDEEMSRRPSPPPPKPSLPLPRSQ